MTTAITTLPAAATDELLTAEAERAVRVLMRKSPATQRTYKGIYERFAGWLAERESGGGTGDGIYQPGVRLLSR